MRHLGRVVDLNAFESAACTATIRRGTRELAMLHVGTAVLRLGLLGARIERGLGHLVELEPQAEFGPLGLRDLVAHATAHEAATAFDKRRARTGCDGQTHSARTGDRHSAGEFVIGLAVRILRAPGEHQHVAWMGIAAAEISARVAE